MTVGLRQNDPLRTELVPPDTAGQAESAAQSQMDVLLWMAAGGLAVPPNLAARVRRAAWHRRLRLFTELAAAAVIVIGLGLWYVATMRQPFQLDGPARVTDASGRPTELASGAWVETSAEAATLRVRGHSTITIAPGSRLQVWGQSRDYALFLDYGELICRTQPNVARLQVETLQGRVAADGTDCIFEVSVSKGEPVMNCRELAVSVMMGLAVVVSQEGVQSLAAGQDAKVVAPVGASGDDVKIHRLPTDPRTAPTTRPAHLRVDTILHESIKAIKLTDGETARIQPTLTAADEANDGIVAVEKKAQASLDEAFMKSFKENAQLPQEERAARAKEFRDKRAAAVAESAASTKKLRDRVVNDLAGLLTAAQIAKLREEISLRETPEGRARLTARQNLPWRVGVDVATLTDDQRRKGEEILLAAADRQKERAAELKKAADPLRAEMAALQGNKDNFNAALALQKRIDDLHSASVEAENAEHRKIAAELESLLTADQKAARDEARKKAEADRAAAREAEREAHTPAGLAKITARDRVAFLKRKVGLTEDQAARVEQLVRERDLAFREGLTQSVAGRDAILKEIDALWQKKTGGEDPADHDELLRLNGEFEKDPAVIALKAKLATAEDGSAWRRHSTELQDAIDKILTPEQRETLAAERAKFAQARADSEVCEATATLGRLGLAADQVQKLDALKAAAREKLGKIDASDTKERKAVLTQLRKDAGELLTDAQRAKLPKGTPGATP